MRLPHPQNLSYHLQILPHQPPNDLFCGHSITAHSNSIPLIYQLYQCEKLVIQPLGLEWNP